MKINGERITEIRVANGWSREELAVKAGVTAQAVYSWEGGNVATFKTLKKVADALGVDEVELLEEE